MFPRLTRVIEPMCVNQGSPQLPRGIVRIAFVVWNMVVLRRLGVSIFINFCYFPFGTYRTTFSIRGRDVVVGERRISQGNTYSSYILFLSIFLRALSTFTSSGICSRVSRSELCEIHRHTAHSIRARRCIFHEYPSCTYRIAVIVVNLFVILISLLFPVYNNLYFTLLGLFGLLVPWNIDSQ